MRSKASEPQASPNDWAPSGCFPIYVWPSSTIRRFRVTADYSLTLITVPAGFSPLYSTVIVDERQQEEIMGKSENKNKEKAAAASEPAEAKLAGKKYAKELARLQVELSHLQAWVTKSGARIVIIFEGRDAAGKGGVIKRLTERVSPRVFRVAALPAPTDREKTQIYMQRYVAHLPAAGEIVIFDRSWYNRPGVERVMGFCPEAKARRFLELAPRFEAAIVESGITLLKYFLDVSEGEQEKR